MKDNDPQTVGDLLSRMGNKGRGGGAAGPAVSSNSNGRPLSRVLSLVLLFVVFAGASAYYFRDLFFKTGKQSGEARTSSRESQAAKREATPTAASPAAATNSLPAPSPQPVQSAETKGAGPPQTTREAGAKPVMVAKGRQQNSLPQEQPKVAPGEATTSEGGSLTVQVGSYAAAADAAKQAQRLKAAGVEASVVRASIPNRGVVYRVQAGHFNDRSEAVRYALRLRSGGLTRDYFITPGGPQQ